MKNKHKTNVNDNNNEYFKYIDFDKFVHPTFHWVGKDTCATLIAASVLDENLGLILLMKETILNNMEKDLLPHANLDIDSSSSTLFDKILSDFGVDSIIEKLFNAGNTNQWDWSSDTKILTLVNWNEIVTKLLPCYKILQIVKEKMDHETHKEMNSPLPKHHMLALILYTWSKECNHSLTQELINLPHNDKIDHNQIQKWRHFDRFLDESIHILDKCETHLNNIYTGFSTIRVDVGKLLVNQDKNEHYLRLKSYQSFSGDLRVAKDFRGYQGLIIGVNIVGMRQGLIELLRNAAMEKIGTHLNADGQVYAWADETIKLQHELLNVNNHDQVFRLFACCDVSWISKYKTEKEVLMGKHSLLMFRSDKIFTVREKNDVDNDYIICDGSTKRVSFQDMFLK